MSQPGVSQLIATITAGMPRMLVGWAAISKFCGKSPRQVRAYVKYGFPAYRWGRNIYSHPDPILRWLIEHERQSRLRRKGQP